MGFHDNVGVVYFLTDGQGRQYAVGASTGHNKATDPYYLSSGIYAGGISNARTFLAERNGATANAGLSFFRNRFYDRATGRWTQEDPIGIAGGLNLFAYVGNDPVSYTDPFGLTPCLNRTARFCYLLGKLIASLTGKADLPVGTLRGERLTTPTEAINETRAQAVNQIRRLASDVNNSDGASTVDESPPRVKGRARVSRDFARPGNSPRIKPQVTSFRIVRGVGGSILGRFPQAMMAIDAYTQMKAITEPTFLPEPGT